MGGWVGGGMGFEFARRGGAEGEGLVKLMKQKIKGINCAVFCFAEKRFFYIYIYEVITWGKIPKRARLYY